MQKVISLFQKRSFREQFPDSSPLFEKDVFVRMQCYSLAIPASEVRPPEEIDIFAETVLKLIALDHGLDDKQIADRMCVSRDLIQFICSHLQEVGLVDKRYRLTENGKRRLQGSSSRAAAPEDCLWQAYAFAQPGTREYLRYLRVGDLATEQVTGGSRHELEFTVGPAGEQHTITGPLLDTGEKPAPVQVMRMDFPPLIRHYNRICTQKSAQFQRIPYRQGYTVDYAEEGIVCLHCKLVIQNGNSKDILLSDGFSQSCTELYRALRKANPQLEQDLWEQAGQTRVGETEKDDASTEKPTSRRQEIAAALCKAVATGIDMDSEQEAAGQNVQLVRDICIAVEKAFYEFAEPYTLADWQLEAFHCPQQEKTGMILEWAMELGLQQAGQYRDLFRWPGRRREKQLLERDPAAEPELTTGLCLAVAIEKGQGPTSFSRLIREMPELLPFLRMLKEAGNHARHDDTVKRAKLQQLMAGCRKLVGLLLPDLPLTEEQKRNPGSDASQRRIDARNAVCGRIGWEVYEELPRSVQERMLRLSPDKACLPSGKDVIFQLSGIMEGVLQVALAELPGVTDIPEKDELLNTIRKNTGRALPEEFQKTNPYYLKQALQGEKEPLKPSYLAYLYCKCKDKAGTVPQAAEEQWMELVDQISDLRGHTSEKANRLDMKQRKQYRDDVFAFVLMIVRAA